jgi:hypothetical protein
VQFHPEMTPGQLRGWLGNGGDELLAELGLDGPGMVDETEAEAPSARTRTHALVDAFLDRVTSAADGPVTVPMQTNR